MMLKYPKPILATKAKCKIMVATSIVLFSVLGCAGTVSSIDGDSNPDSLQIYPISSEDADRILSAAMQNEFDQDPITRVVSPHDGYQVTYRWFLDSHTVTAYMIPAKGRESGGRIVDGFAFKVEHSGTIFSGPSRAENAFEKIIIQAEMLANSLPLASGDGI